MKKIEFFKESIRNLKTVGTLTRSSKYLCKGMIKPVDFENANVIVELGAGDGVITKHILKHMKSDSKLLAFEVNTLFCDQMRSSINDDRLVVIEDSAEKLGEYLAKYNLGKADYVISAIPFVAFPEELAKSIINISKDNMKDNALFVQVHYSLLTKKFYQSIFGNVDV
ncbi:MAG TPA: ribosomal RNA adenine dimethylase, partial [Phaeodactylibacter sp.]|nr:ribosomal RNA adenine dimethylase [Phaeodactylibacter sp.]